MARLASNRPWVLQGARSGKDRNGLPWERELIGDYHTQEAAIAWRDKLLQPKFVRKGPGWEAVQVWNWTAITRKKNTDAH